ncbi:hypothetical protein Raf01_83580 [Rugosimonospora africana]|uniref:Uncharacterized protein n=1 Tax=Rugosimonospora africana TaxID=556532 RepID=A0A8J3VVW4_9ACTN|nr:hypothetical protein Raf01_83580 [Rugosimonospora africana]
MSIIEERITFLKPVCPARVLARAGIPVASPGSSADAGMGVVIGFLPWILRPSGRGGIGTPAQQGRGS